jgi:hypothetical protein
MPVIGLTEFFRCWAIRRFGQRSVVSPKTVSIFRRMMQTDPSCMTPLQILLAIVVLYQISGGSPMAVSLLFEPTYKR